MMVRWSNEKKKYYLAVMQPDSRMGAGFDYRILEESQIGNIRLYGEYVNLYEMGNNKPISKTAAKKLGLKYYSQ